MATRTNQQRKSIELYCKHLAKALNDAGWTMKKVLLGNLENEVMTGVKNVCPEHISSFEAVFDRYGKKVDLSWGQVTIKEHLWRPIQRIMFKKESTTELSTGEVSQVYEELNRLTASKYGVSVEFPNSEPPLLGE